MTVTWGPDDNNNLYRKLGLPSPQASNRPSQEDIKRAYRRALLENHPDKARRQEQAANTPRLRQTGSFPVTDIIQAYNTLINPSKRAEYDRSLRLRSSQPSRSTSSSFKPPSNCETVDLDDLTLDTEINVWYTGCRCGAERGYSVSEDELEENCHVGVIHTSCGGCSLWLKVEFQAAEGNAG